MKIKLLPFDDVIETAKKNSAYAKTSSYREEIYVIERSVWKDNAILEVKKVGIGSYLAEDNFVYPKYAAELSEDK